MKLHEITDLEMDISSKHQLRQQLSVSPYCHTNHY